MVMCRRPCGGVGGPCDFSVSPSPFGLDFGTLDFGTSDSGLTIRGKFLLGIIQNPKTITVAAWESTTTALNKFETMTPVTVKS